jgi:FMN reductase
MQAKVLVVAGSARQESPLQAVAQLASARVQDAGAQLRRTDLAQIRLPLLEYGSSEQPALPEVLQVRTDAAWAHGFVIVTPEYHGNMSGALKNWFDYLYPELAGKFAGVVSVTGGGSGDMSIAAVKNTFAWCHGFTLPFHAAVRPDDFLGGALVGSSVVDRITRIACDVVRYAPVIHATFELARQAAPDSTAGVAGLHPALSEETPHG